MGPVLPCDVSMVAKAIQAEGVAMENNKDLPIQPKWLALYAVIAIAALATALYVLLQGPEPGWPLNLLHVLFKQ